MEEKSRGFVDKGAPVYEATLYIYCDVCGSFNIMLDISTIKLLIIAVIIAVIVTGAVLVDIQWLACLITLGLFSLLLPWRDIMLSYKCRKCGNTRFTNHNSLHYQSYDTSVIDVPDRFTQKRYIDTDVIHFE